MNLTTNHLLEVRNLRKYFPVGRNQVLKAVDDVSFSIDRGEALGLAGESGSGKTTVGRCVLRLIEPDGGSLVFNGTDYGSMSGSQLRWLRPRLQIVFQEAGDALNPRMSVRSIAHEPLALEKRLPREEQRDRVEEVLDLVRVAPVMRDMYPHQLGSGEQQRAGIARALATSPDLVVLDEPTSALDVSLRAEILDLLSNLLERLGMSYLCISHDLTAVRRICNDIAIMYLGKIVEKGPTEEIFRRPLHPYSRALLGSVLYPDPKQRLTTFRLKGEIPSPIHLPPGCYLSSRCAVATEGCNIAYPPMEEVLPGRMVSCFRVQQGDLPDALLGPATQ